MDINVTHTSEWQVQTPARYRLPTFIGFVVYLSGNLGALWLLNDSSTSVMIIYTIVHLILLGIYWRRAILPNTTAAEPGLLFIAVAAIYTLFPLISFVAFDYNLGADSDNRLSAIALDDRFIGQIAASANAIIAGFAVAYAILRKPRRPANFSVQYADTLALWIGLGTALLVIAIPSLLGTEKGSGYASEYLFYQSLPIVVQQILNIVSNLALICAFGLMASYASAGKFHITLSIALVCCVYFGLATSARTPLVLIAGGLLLVRDLFVKPFSLAQLGVIVVAVLIIFLGLGFARDGLSDINYVAGRSEFMAVFVTALDIQQLYVTGSTLDMNLNLLLSDLFRLIPQQFLPFEKIDPATWYVTTFYPSFAEQGGGLAFGILAESQLGGSFVAASIRGLALGSVTAVAFNYLTARSSIWRTIIYVWLFTGLYQAFRDTTFTLVGRFVFQVAPGVFLIFVLGRLVTPLSRRLGVQLKERPLRQVEAKARPNSPTTP